MNRAPKVKSEAREAVLRVRATMILRGTTMCRWAIENGYNARFVIAAIRGERVGPRSRAIVAHLRAEGAL